MLVPSHFIDITLMLHFILKDECKMSPGCEFGNVGCLSASESSTVCLTQVGHAAIWKPLLFELLIRGLIRKLNSMSL